MCLGRELIPRKGGVTEREVVLRGGPILYGVPVNFEPEYKIKT